MTAPVQTPGGPQDNNDLASDAASTQPSDGVPSGEETDGVSSGEETDGVSSGEETDGVPSVDEDAGEADCPTGCFIDGICHGADAPDPDNACRHCDPAQSATDWSVADGKACDDGLFCTEGDVCDQGACVGQPRVCDDGVACNGTEECDEATSQCAPGTSTCMDGQSCDVSTGECSSDCTGCVIGGSCYAAGDSSSSNPCLTCDPARSMSDWSAAMGASCDDGDLCTEDDACDAAGECAGTAKVCDDDTEECGATRACDSGTGECVPTFAGNRVTCDDGDSCTVNDRCDGAGNCEGSAMDCDDEYDCTMDSCVGGSCVNEVAANMCLIDDMYCVPDGYVAEHNSCMSCDPAVDDLAWTEQTNSCIIDDECYADGETHPTQTCLSCDTASSTTDWTVAAGTCFDGSTCGGCCTDPTSKNQAANPGFATSGSGWNVTGVASWSSEDADSCSTSGSISITNGSIAQCMNVELNTTYYFGLKYRRNPNGGFVCQFTGSDEPCGADGSSFFGGVIETGQASSVEDWQDATPKSIGSGSMIVSITITCSDDGEGGNIDQVYLSEGSAGY